MLFKTACVNLTGRGHIQNNIPCQDSVADCITETTACITLSDGAGSYAQSHIASKTVSATLCNEICRNFDKWYTMEDTNIQNSIVQLGRNAVDDGIEPACTLILFAKNEDGRTLLIHLGDGIVFGTNSEKENIILSEPENGEEKYITYFINSSNAEIHVRIQRAIPLNCDTVILCSDGSASALVTNDLSFIAPAVGELGRIARELPKRDTEEHLKNSMTRFILPNTTDDISLAILNFSSEKIL